MFFKRNQFEHDESFELFFIFGWDDSNRIVFTI